MGLRRRCPARRVSGAAHLGSNSQGSSRLLRATRICGLPCRVQEVTELTPCHKTPKLGDSQTRARAPGHGCAPVLTSSVVAIHAAVGGLFPPMGRWNGSIDIEIGGAHD